MRESAFDTAVAGVGTRPVAHNPVHPTYRPDIDGLRAVAVLSVVTYHAFPSLLPGGFIGVDVFFVISGFLISGIILGNLERGAFSIADFYCRRINRLFPALLVVLAATYLLGWITLLAAEFSQLGKHIAGGATFTSNLLLWRESGYFDNEAARKPLLHLWSLGVEEQFYVFWPLLVWLAWTRRINMLAVIVAIAACSFALGMLQTASDPTAAFYSPFSRFWELMLGAMLACASVQRRRTLPVVTATVRVARLAASVIGAALLVSALALVREQDFPGWWATLPTVGTLLLIAAGPGGLFNRTILSSKPLVWFGLISFPLYLWHWPLLSLVEILQDEPAPALRGFLALLAVALAWLTYRFVETPVRHGSSRKRTAVALGALMVIAGCAGFATYQLDGLRSRAVVAQNIDPDTGFDGGWPEYATDCDFVGPEQKDLFYCAVDARGMPRFALIGDSKAGALFPGLFRTSSAGGTWLFIGSGDGGPLLPVLSDHLIYSGYNSKAVEDAIAVVGAMESIDTVVIATATRALFNLGVDDSIEGLPGSNNLEPALEGLDAAVRRIVSAGKHVVLLVDNPTLPPKEDCIDRTTSSALVNRLLIRPSSRNCHLPLARHRQLSRKYRDLLLEIERRHPGNVSVFDATGILCDEAGGICSPTKGGRLLYGITDHISDYAATLVGRALNEFLASRRPDAGTSGVSP